MKTDPKITLICFEDEVKSIPESKPFDARIVSEMTLTSTHLFDHYSSTDVLTVQQQMIVIFANI